MAVFIGDALGNVANAPAGILSGFTGGTLAQLQDAFGDEIDGLGGNDHIVAGNGNDVINGGDGDDYIDGRSGYDVMDGGAGVDTMDVSWLIGSYVWNMATGVTNYSAFGESAFNFENCGTGAGDDGITGNAANNLISLGAGDDAANGGLGDDTLNGGGGNDTLNGGAGNDTLIGGNGNDTYIVDNASDKVFEAVSGGTDTVYASVNYALQAGQEVEALRANAGATGLLLTGNEFNNIIVGLTGNDNLNGGLGNDTLNGGDGNDTLNGGAGNDVLSGGNGNDVLDGQAGADLMAGGAGDDRYLVDNALDKVIESVGGGTDTVFASANYALQAGQEVEFLRANAGSTGLALTGNEFNNTLIGGAGNDALTGGNGNDTLNGLVGVDNMSGGAGNDTYAVDNALDKVFEALGGGTDTVFASVNYALQAGQEVEFLRANAGTTGLFLAGNEFNNTLVGGAGNDNLDGGVGNDLLSGGAGNDSIGGGAGNDVLSGGDGTDFLVGGAGADVMAGGAGDDAYLVDNALDKIIEAVGGGTDTVFAGVNYALQAGQEVEFLNADAGATGLTLTGNEFANIIVGRTGDDALNGGGGNDTLNGGDGNDTLNGGNGNDTLFGGNGNDALNGQAGADFMAGEAGNDLYLVDNAADQVFEGVGGGTDTVFASVNYALQAGLEVEALRANAGATGLILTGNEFNNLLVGLTGNDTLNGGLGNDTLNGGAGNDTLNGGAGNDVLNGLFGVDLMAGGAGNDTFAWTASTEGGDNITDFKVAGVDVLRFNAAAFGFAPGHVLVNGSEFIANTSPVSNHAGPTFLMNTNLHNLSFDADGTGAGAAVLITHMNADAVASDLHLV